jgi:hypothetical protein
MQILENGRNTNEPPATTQAAAEFLRQELKTIFRTGVSAVSAHTCAVQQQHVMGRARSPATAAAAAAWTLTQALVQVMCAGNTAACV